jgi:hypothetical protein
MCIHTNKTRSLFQKAFIYIFYMLWIWSGPSSTILRPFIGLLQQPWMTDGDDCGAVSGINEWQGKPKYSEETCHSAALSTTDPMWLEPGSNPGRCGEKRPFQYLNFKEDSFRHTCVTRLERTTVVAKLLVWLGLQYSCSVHVISCYQLKLLLPFTFARFPCSLSSSGSPLSPISCTDLFKRYSVTFRNTREGLLI